MNVMKQDISMQNKKSFYFSHDSNARNDEKIIRLRMDYGAKGYGIYFMLIEMLMESSDYKLFKNYSVLAFHLHSTSEVVQAVIENYGLFEFSDDSDFFYSVSLIQRLKPLEQLRESRRKAGIKSGEARRAKAGVKANVSDKKGEVNDSVVGMQQVCNKLGKCKVEGSTADSKTGEDVINVGNILKTKQLRFVPPTIQELEKYCSESKLKINAGSFLDYYQSKGWLVGRNKMKDWKAAVRNWYRRDLDTSKLGFTNTSTANFSNFRNDKVYERF